MVDGKGDAHEFFFSETITTAEPGVYGNLTTEFRGNAGTRHGASG
jgi:hypothetical protein